MLTMKRLFLLFLQADENPHHELPPGLHIPSGLVHCAQPILYGPFFRLSVQHLRACLHRTIVEGNPHGCDPDDLPGQCTSLSHPQDNPLAHEIVDAMLCDSFKICFQDEAFPNRLHVSKCVRKSIEQLLDMAMASYWQTGHNKQRPDS